MKRLIKNILLFIGDITGLLMVLFYQMRTQRFRSIKCEERSNPLLILGNGPSLSTIKENIEERSKVDLCCVNFSILTDIFYELKPEVLIFADPTFFNVISDDSNLKKKVENVYQSISTRIDWPINIQIPFGVSKTFLQICNSNPNVKVSFYTMCEWNVVTAWAKKIRFRLFKRSIVIPVVQNVVVGAIFNAINKGYTNIQLYGVEHSWLKYTYVNDKNENCLLDEHYYGKNECIWRNQDGTPMPLYELLSCLTKTFRSYFELKEYADYLGDVKIINKTPGSYIDAFERG